MEEPLNCFEKLKRSMFLPIHSLWGALINLWKTSKASTSLLLSDLKNREVNTHKRWAPVKSSPSTETCSPSEASRAKTVRYRSVLHRNGHYRVSWLLETIKQITQELQSLWGRSPASRTCEKKSHDSSEWPLQCRWEQH